MKFFKFCLNNRIKILLKNQCKKSKSGCKLYLNENKYIVVNFRKLNDHFYVKVSLSDTIAFLKYVFENDLLCNRKKINNHNCNMMKYYYDYIYYIAKNNITDHLKKLIFDKNIKFPYDPESFKPKGLYNLRDYIIEQTYKYSSKEIIKYITHSDDYHDYICLLIETPHEVNINVTKFLLEKLQKYLIEYFSDDINLKKLPNDNLYCPMNHEIFYRCICNDNLESYIYIIDKTCEIFEELSELKIKKNLMHEYSRCIENFDPINRNFHIYHCLRSNASRIAEYLLNEGINISHSAIDEIIEVIMDKKLLKSFEFLLEKKFIDANKINELFQNSHKYNYQIAELLISYGADIDNHGQQVIEHAQKSNNIELIYCLHNMMA
ncbi:hypothetical protein QLL95_gp0482 [Cotonvirus japonicus]|uniref:Ankyrin repeat protein n=1 Tax=Cotonvirus japonicus TaxID=2811091 RepID=A0ABM7NUA2_9VIRU|nr:hypothetical protein QLL95_gp0482 [Cotonvirus japonicus]BCS83641.1 hypothetical protein [Cotonvirus japonicus]